MTVVVY